MDARSLRELELLAVAKLYGLQAAGQRLQEPGSVVLPPVARSLPQTMDWPALRESVAGCSACGLCKERKQVVFGVGSETAQWLFIGEGPGADEDAHGEPFVGQAGRLLDGMMAAIGIKRGREAYIANVVKCRPPGNRTPTLEEAAACAPFLDRQVDLIAPKLIVALGKTAAMRLLNTDASLGSLRGQVHRYRGTPLVVTYHPAYLLRNLPDKAKAWEDLLFARRELRRIEQGASA
ncbi:MAG TPA: uracil-DNA glycosylase [Usitatibacter sp.]|nr:uracil-DNA glycosylase [Usitatibacter sp.]